MNDDDEVKSVGPGVPLNPPEQPPPLAAEFVPADDFGPIEGGMHAFGVLEALLKHPKRLYTEVREGRRRGVVIGLILISLVSLLGYGLIAGAFSGGRQIWIAPIKIAVGLTLSGLICLPSLYIFSCLGQIDVKFTEVVSFLVAMVALMAVMLVGLAPVLFVFTMSTESLAFMGCMHLILWAIAGYFGYRFFNTVFNYMHGAKGGRGFMVLWMYILTFVVLQMSTSLRPIIGRSHDVLTSEKKFFAAHWVEQMFPD